MHTIYGELFGYGIIGIGYDTHIGFIGAHILVALIMVLAVIGLIATISFIIKAIKNHKKETPGEKWMRTGRMD